MPEHPHRATIPPVPAGVPRPLWSVMIPTFNCAAYLRETLASVLAQDPGPDQMQIEVVDDRSTADDPEAVVAEVGRGRVAFFRQPANVGHTRNFETCLRRARGHLVHQLHGDDAVREGFYAAMARAFERRPDVGAAYCRPIFMDAHGHWTGVGPLDQHEAGVRERWLETIALGQQVQTPTVVVRRSVYEHLGGFDRRLTWTEDWEMWVRIAAHYPVWYEPQPLAVYRLHGASSSGRLSRTGETMRDVRRAIAINREVLPRDRADAITRAAGRANALGGLRRAYRALMQDDLATPLVQVREALRTSPTAGVALSATALLARWAARAVRRTVRPRALTR